MLVEVKTIPWQLNPSGRTRRLAVLICDQCGVKFERPARYAGHTTHLCSRTCLDRAHAAGGALDAKIRATMVDRYGAANASSSEILKERKRRTWMLKLGVDHPFKSDVVKSKIKTTMLTRHGVRSPMQSQKIRRKAREGMLSWTSKIERQFGDELRKKFSDVQVQVWVNDKCVDFYLPSTDLYIQFDGAYWHGLDRPIERIAEGKTPRDVQIHRKWLSDREQDAWFQQQGLRLVRITDVEYKRMGTKVFEVFQ